MTTELPRIGVEVLYDVDETPPADLLLGRYHRDDHTIVFADGGVGKGVLTARDHVVMLMDDPEMRLGIIDYEQHARSEWKPRMRQFAQTIAHDSVLLKRVHIFTLRPDISLWHGMDDLLPFIEDRGINRLLCDSAAYACGELDPESSMAPRLYSAAVAELRLPMTTLAHVTKQNLDPPHPYGSVFWSNGARVTVGMVGDGEDGPRILRNKKTNQNSRFKPLDIDWSWASMLGPGVMPTDLTFVAHGSKLIDRVIEALRAAPLKTDGIAAALDADGSGEVDGKTLTRTLTRASGPNGPLISDGHKPATWSLAGFQMTRKSVAMQSGG